MKPTQDPPAALPRALTCNVVAHAHVQVAPENLPLLRQRPGPGLGQSLPASTLKHADEQTVAGLAAVFHAIADFDLAANPFEQWGIVAAPCFLGRATLVQSRERYAVEGAWGLSPHFIPHRSQHAVSGTISQVLKVHGPNFGTGGGPGAVREALVAGAVLAQDNPGVWVVMTDWEPEFIPDADGRPLDPVICHGLAVALVRAAWQDACLRIVPQLAGAGDGADRHHPSPPAPSLRALAQALADRQAAAWSWEGFGCIDWSGCGRPVNGNPTAPSQSIAGRHSPPPPSPVPEKSNRVEGVHTSGVSTENAR